MIRKWQYIIIHHSLTKDSQTVSWQAIRHYHIYTMGWLDIGYHFGIELVNGEYEVLVGRNLNADGAHCKEAGMNRKAIGICLIGNFDEEEVPQAMWLKAVSFVRGLMEIFDIPVTSVYGHRDFAPYKSCPGKLFRLERFREDLL